MRVIHTISEMTAEAAAQAARQASVGFVPTMGALHAGHMSLIDRAREENDVVVLSIFVNPTQFMPGEDLATYPRTLDDDLAQAEKAGVDIVFVPAADEMYRPRYQTTIHVHELSKPLCGMSRGLGHFVGVATVVAKLFNLVRPTRAYFGQKDAQQAVVIQRMVIDLNFPVDVVVCPVIRESDGLAMSSRNRNLPDHLRKRALALRNALCYGREMIKRGERSAEKLFNEMAESILKDEAVEMDYLHIVSPETLEEVETVDDLVLIAGAIKIGGVRLIDNMLVGPSGPWND